MQNKCPNYLILTIWLGILVYVFYRGFILDLTHDEAYSFFNIKHFWHVQFLCNANSHWLNSLGMKCASMAGLESPGALRWLSLVSFLGFSAVAFSWLKTIREAPLQILAFAFLFLNPFVLDYFSMARGYASAMAFQALSLMFFAGAITTENRVFVYTSLFLAGLSAIANFNFFYFFIMFSAIYNYQFYLSKGLNFLKKRRFYIDALTILGFSLLVLRALLFIKRCSNDFEFGGESLIGSVFAGFLDSLLYEKNNEDASGFYAAAIVMGIIVFSSALFGVLKFKRHQNKIYTTVSILLLLMFAALVVNHYLFSVVYPYYRTALPLFLPMVICLVYFTGAIGAVMLRTSIALILAAILVVNLGSKVNFNYTFDFYHQSESKDCFDLAEKLGAKKVGISPEHYGVFINYYQATDKHRYSFYGERANTYDPKPGWKENTRLEDFDHLVLFPPYNLKFYKGRNVKLDAVKLFPRTGTLLIKVTKLS